MGAVQKGATTTEPTVTNTEQYSANIEAQIYHQQIDWMPLVDALEQQFIFIKIITIKLSCPKRKQVPKQCSRLL